MGGAVKNIARTASLGLIGGKRKLDFGGGGGDILRQLEKSQIIGKGGQLKEPFRLGGRPGSEFEQMRERFALGGASPRFQALRAQQEAQQEDLVGRVAETGATQAAQAQSQLAARGGASAGARERLAEQIARQGALQRQQIRGAGAQQQLGITAQEEAERQRAQGGLAALAEQRQRIDLGRAIQEQQSIRDLKGRVLASDAEAKAQQQLASKTGGTFGGGGFLGLGF